MAPSKTRTRSRSAPMKSRFMRSSLVHLRQLPSRTPYATRPCPPCRAEGVGSRRDAAHDVRFALDPTPAQEQRLAWHAGASRFAYNECLRFLTSSHGLKPCDSRFTLPLPSGDISGALRACGRPALTGRPVPARLRLRDSPVEDCSTPACTGVLEHRKRYSGASHVEQVRVDRGVHVADEERREHVPVGFDPAAAAVGPLAAGPCWVRTASGSGSPRRAQAVTMGRKGPQVTTPSRPGPPSLEHGRPGFEPLTQPLPWPPWARR